MSFKYLSSILLVMFCHQQNVLGANVSFQYLDDWCSHHMKVNNDGTCNAPGTFTIPGNCTSFYECTKDTNGSTIIAHIRSCGPGFIFDILGCVQDSNHTQCPQMRCTIHASEIPSKNGSTIANHTQEMQRDESSKPLKVTTETHDIILLPVSNESLIVLTDKFISNISEQNVVNESVQIRQHVLNYSQEEKVNETHVDFIHVEAQIPKENTTGSSREQNATFNMTFPNMTNGKVASILIHPSKLNEVQNKENHTQNHFDSQILNEQGLIGSHEVHLSNLSSLSDFNSGSGNSSGSNATVSEHSGELVAHTDNITRLHSESNENSSSEVDESSEHKKSDPQDDHVENDVNHLVKSESHSHAQASSHSDSGSNYLKIDLGIISGFSFLTFGLYYI